MFASILSLLLLILPGFSLLHIKWIHNNINYNKIDKCLIGFIIWIFYITFSILIFKIIFINYLKYIFFFNYLLGFILIGYLLYTKIPEFLNVISIAYKINKISIKIRLNIILFFLLPIIGFIVIITFYTPLIYQYDALAMYLMEGRQLIENSLYLSETWPTFGDSMPIMPIIYSWFFYLTKTPLIRLIPLSLFFLTILLVYTIAKKISSTNSAYISVVSFVSMISLQWYMSKTSLYIDLCFMFFSASSIYALIIALEEEFKKLNFFILGINLAILLLSKEYGIFYTLFIIGFLFFLRLKKIIKIITYCSLIYSIFLIIPFSIYIFNYMIIYSFTKNIDILSEMIFKSLIIIIYLFIQTIILIRDKYTYIKLNLSNLLITIIPLIYPALFFINNFLVKGSPLASLKETYIESLYEMGIVFMRSTTVNVSFFNIPNLFLSNGLFAMNFFPLLFFLLNLLIPRIQSNQDNHCELLASWFFYSLLIFFYVTYGYIEGGHIRRILILAIPVALIVGKGIHNLLEYYSITDYIGNLIYVSSISIFLAYIWFIKLNGTKWWIINLDTLIYNFIYARPIEVILYAVPWLLLFIFIELRKKNLVLFKLHSKKLWANVYIIIIFFSAIIPSIIFIQAIKYPKTWNPSYYDKADSVKLYAYHWYIPIIDFYCSQLSDDDWVTIGFGVAPIQYFLERSFIDLDHPRNWLLYLPLFQETSTDALLNYLDSLNARYFLIPTETYNSRDRYEAALNTSILFKLISTSNVFTSTDGQRFFFERLAEFNPLVLYVLKRIPNSIPIDMQVGEDYISHNYELFYDHSLEDHVVSFNINNSVTGGNALNYAPNIPINFANVASIVLAMKRNLKGKILEFKLASERP